MTSRDSSSAALLAEAEAAFRQEIFGHLPTENRYLGAMIANAMAIARRALEGEAEAEARRLLVLIYGDDKKADLRRLAADLRSGSVNAVGRESLELALKKLVIAELRARNPRLLRSRGFGDPG